MIAGFAEVDITPKPGNMPGQFSIFKSTDGTIGGLFANAAAFTSGENSVIFVSADALFVSVEQVNEIRKKIFEVTGVPCENILVAATHTHTGGPVDFKTWGTPADPEGAKLTTNGIVKAAIAAWNNRQAVKIGAGKTYDTRFSFNRDYCMDDGFTKTNVGYAKAAQIRGRAGAVDYAVDAMRVDDMNGKPKCFIVNYANHPDNEPMPRNKYSADYIGYMRRELKKVYGDNVIVLYFNGTAGDINAADFWHSTDKGHRGEGKNSPKYIGEGIAEDVVNMNIATDIEDMYISAISKEYTVKTRKPKQENLDWAESVKDKMGTGELRDFEEGYAETYLNYDEATWPETDEMEIHTIRFGPWTIVGLGGEIYTEIGLRIKRDSPYKNTLVFSLANGSHGYIPTDYILDTKAYPAKWGRYVTYVGYGTADTLVEKSLEQLDKFDK